MTDWQRHLDLYDVWNTVDKDDTKQLMALAKTVAERLEALDPHGLIEIDERKDEIVDMFEGMANDDTLTVEQFDLGFAMLYDWGDTKISGGFFDAKKVCWVNVMFPPKQKEVAN